MRSTVSESIVRFRELSSRICSATIDCPALSDSPVFTPIAVSGEKFSKLPEFESHSVVGFSSDAASISRCWWIAHFLAYPKRPPNAPNSNSLVSRPNRVTSDCGTAVIDVAFACAVILNETHLTPLVFSSSLPQYRLTRSNASGNPAPVSSSA